VFFHKKETIHTVNINGQSTFCPAAPRAIGERPRTYCRFAILTSLPLKSIKDMLQDIAFEEFGHLEMVGKPIETHTKMLTKQRLTRVLYLLWGMGPHFQIVKVA